MISWSNDDPSLHDPYHVAMMDRSIAPWYGSSRNDDPLLHDPTLIHVMDLRALDHHNMISWSNGLTLLHH